MKIEELLESLDRPWTLVPADDRINQMIASTGINPLKFSAYQNKDDLSQVMFIAYINGAWEVHHSVLLDSGPESGRRLSPAEGLGLPNTGFIAAALKLYKEKLDTGSAIRIVAPRDMSPKSLWNTYSRIINRIIAKDQDKYQPSEPNYDYVDSQGTPRISQVIRPWGGKRDIEEAFLGIKRTKY